MRNRSVKHPFSIGLMLIVILSVVLFVSVSVSAADNEQQKRGMTKEAYAERLAVKVEAGTLTQADADAKLEGWKARPGRPGKRARTKEAYAERLAVAVLAGKLTQADADAKLESWKANPKARRLRRIGPIK